MPQAGRPGFSYLIFFLSGIAGLGYELAWTRMFTVGLGHDVPSVLAVVAAYFVGLAVGAWLLDGPVSRSNAPQKWYAALEAIIGIWGLMSIWIIPWCNEGTRSLIGLAPGPLRHWSVAFIAPALALLPATTAMGATLPAMERLISAALPGRRHVGGLYAANTFGAVVGVALSAAVLAPSLGFRGTILVLAAINFVCAIAVMLVPARPVAAHALTSADSRLVPKRWRLGATIFMTGFLGVGYEVLGVRVLAQVLEDTIYSFAAALAAYLMGTALGAALYQRFAGRAPFHATLAWLVQGICISCLLGIFAMWYSGDLYELGRRWLGGNVAGAVGAELMLGVTVFGLPSVLMGATFSHLAQSARRPFQQSGLGQAVALNTFGAALAAPLLGVVLLPMIGAKFALVAVSLTYLMLMPQVTRAAIIALPLIAGLVLALPTNLHLVAPPPGGHVREYREGVMAAVAVVEDSSGGRFLKVNDRFMMGGTVANFAERRATHIPLLLHPDPRRVLFLGVGTGVTMGAATAHRSLHADGVELVPEVIELIDHFEPANASVHHHAGCALFVADARRFVRVSEQRYDVIVGDLFHPARDGAGALYSLEHFRAVRERLAPGGIFCQWLPLYQLDLEMVRVITRTYLEVFPHAQAFLSAFNVQTPMLGLLASEAPLALAPDWHERRVREAGLAAALHQLALGDGLRVLGCLLADEVDLAAFAAGADLNTDDWPVVIFEAPRFAYDTTTTSYGRLFDLLERFDSDGASVIAGEGQDAEAFRARLSRYIQARDVFLHGMVLQIEGQHEQAMEAHIRSARISHDFTTGYAICIQEARRLARSDPARSRAILRELAEAQPGNPEANAVLRQLFGR